MKFPANKLLQEVILSGILDIDSWEFQASGRAMPDGSSSRYQDPKMRPFMIFWILTKPMKINQKLSLRNCSDGIFDGIKNNVIFEYRNMNHEKGWNV